MINKHLTKLLVAIITSVIFTFQLYGHESYSIYETNQLFHPEEGLNGAVATQEQNATRVGIDILQNGGNAVDAAVAIGYTLAVTLPRAGNLGGGGFMTIWLNKEQKAYVINYRERAPANINLEKIIHMPRSEFINSYYASGVPGTVAGLNLAANKFGTKKLENLIRPAIELAEHGFNLNITQVNGRNFAQEKISTDPEARKIFFKKKSKPVDKKTETIDKLEPYSLNEKFTQEDLANTLKLISKFDNDGFYKGETADKILSEFNKKGVKLEKSDLENYQAEIVEPVSTTYKDYTIYAPPPPSSGGVTLAEILNILEILDISKIPFNSANYYHYLTESFNLAYLDKNYQFGDPKFIQNNIDKFLSKEYAKSLAKKINKKYHTPSEKIDTNKITVNEGTNTTHYVVIDKNKNIVSNTYTLNSSFGNGKIVPGTGFFMNNELDDFTIKLGEANTYGLIQGKSNLIEPYKQPLSSMTPVIILDPDKNPYLATGSPGGSRIITTVSQVILNSLSNNFNINTAVSIPRIHSQLWPDILYYEQGISPDTIAILTSMGHKTELTQAMGSAQTLAQDDIYYKAVADPRRAGAKAITY